MKTSQADNSLYPLKKRLSPVKKRMSTLVRKIPMEKRSRALARSIYHVTRAKLELRSLNQHFRRTYGGPVLSTIDPRDEMYRFISDYWDWPYHETRMPHRVYAPRAYLASGEKHFRVVEEVFAQAGHPLPSVRSFLEFACGYGRMTRFLVHRVNPTRVTVSDISAAAVAFVSTTLGVQSFVSVADPRDLDHNARYEAIYVGSLFTHLNYEYWAAWLERLYSLLEDKGVLVFTTHSPRVLEELYGAGWAPQVKRNADGFSFLETNETHGRLATDYYGATFVTESFVRGVVQANTLGRITAFYPWTQNYQDVYVLERVDSISPNLHYESKAD